MNDPKIPDFRERFIPAKLVEHLDSMVLTKAGLGILSRGPMEIALAACEAFVGIRERPAKSNDGPIVRLINDVIGDATPQAWCMAAMQAAIAYAEIKSGKKSRLYGSEHCMTVWRNTPVDMRCQLKRGAIIIWNKPGSDAGHTGMVDKFAVQTMNTYEGNTTAGLEAGKIVRDGDGFYYCQRPTVSTPSMKLVGFLDPFKEAP
jgi:hypothetical protein